jgi:predicted extracellular nuclease/2',3'-cyclic-nucleotide 2'-phosphodiesterase (5'-nucleotidase family)
LAAGLTPLAVAPAHADVATKIATYPYTQAWTSTSAISVNDSWSGVTGVQGYLGQDITTSSAGADPQTLLTESALANDSRVSANQSTPNTVTSGGVAEFDGISDPSIALQGSGTADAPYVAFHLDLTGQTNVTFAFNARDLDGSADNAAQQIAVQYRVGAAGSYTNLPDGYIADATTGGTATQVTARSVSLPASVDNQSSVFVRVITSNASGSDEWVGIDDVTVTAEGGTSALALANPGPQTSTVGIAITPLVLATSGGTTPYTFAATGLPDGLSLNTETGTITGTPTTAGNPSVEVTVTDDADVTDTESFVWSVNEPASVIPIAEIQGTDAATSPKDGQTVSTEGVVTAMYKDRADAGNAGGFDGMYIQTGGTGDASDETPGASDAVFVFGDNSMPAGVGIGDSVRVTGLVSEFFTLTEITPQAGGVVELDTPLAPVTALSTALPTTAAGRETHEGELLAPTDTFTVSNSYNINTFAEIGLATGGRPLVQPTEVVADDDTAGLAAIKADNFARGIVLDDGHSLNYLTNSTAKNLPLPWLTPTRSIRVGAAATLQAPVVLDFRNNVWKFQPTTPLIDDGAAVATFEDTRPDNLAPQAVGGDLKLATFNVLNYFNTTGQQYVATGAAQVPPVNTQCTYYTDREDTPIANRTCGVVTNGVNAGNGPRGAATAASLARQQAKIVTAINALDADIVGLQEIENSMKLLAETNRDDALAQLVGALNADTGASTWRFVHSPAEAVTSTNLGFQDVIRPAFIYKQATVRPVGQSDIYFEQSANATSTTPAGAFANAREPLAQAFKPKGAKNSESFAVILNHFKSKGDSDPAATGDNANSPDTGAFNGDRTRQATKLAEFANKFASDRDIEAVFLAGDFNSYSKEDPIQVLDDANYTLIESDTAGEESYSFSGLSGSLDHVLGNPAAMAMVTGADIWDINASESPAYQYSRFNYNVTQFFNADDPFAASDHNPEVVGIDVPDFTTTHTEVQILGTNDFHGRLLEDGANSAGAAILTGAVDELRGDIPNTTFAAAGDLVGASTFESFIQNDEPTIEALNEAGLDVSAAGNHEFDQGYEDFVGRIQDGANWEYIAANVEEPTGRDDLAETWTQTFGDIKVGYVGAVTEDLPALVSPSGIEGVTVTDIVDSTNEAADQLKADGADLVVLLVHEGSPSTTCSTMTDASTAWGNIVTGVNDNVDAIVSGHTHLAYNCKFTVDGWAGRSVTERPVVSAGQYGTFLNQLVFTFEGDEVVEKDQELIGLTGTGYAADSEVAQTVAAAKAQADVLGAQVLGKVGGPFNRAKLSNGTTENRGGESTLGNLVAEVQRWATSTPEAGAAQIAFMNPGGLRADMTGTGSTFPADLTYKQAAVVQPFANTLVNMRMTGAQIKTALEQQWQRDSSGNVPSRPFLRLGISKGFTYTYDPTRAEGDRVLSMTLDGSPVSATSSYSVTVNSFLASGGDNFRIFNQGAQKRDTGKVDLQAMVDYMEEFADVSGGDAPLAPDYTQRSVGVSFPSTAPTSYSQGDAVKFTLSSLAFSTSPDVKDSQVEVRLGGVVVGTAPVDNTIGTAVFDEYGTAAVTVTVPAGTPNGPAVLKVTGTTTGTTFEVPITVATPAPTPDPTPTPTPTPTPAPEPEKVDPVIKAVSPTGTVGERVRFRIRIKAGDETATGWIKVRRKGSDKVYRFKVVDGKAIVKLPAFSRPGIKKLVVRYLGDDSVQREKKVVKLTIRR